MVGCRRVIRTQCERCDRYVKTPARSCLNISDYQSCHKLCKPCWRKYRWDNYDRDSELQKNYVHCMYCRVQSCYYCGGSGKWHGDVRLVLCYDCL